MRPSSLRRRLRTRSPRGDWDVPIRSRDRLPQLTASLVLLALLGAGCVTEPGAPKDAGEVAFVRRAIPLLWGRPEEGATEVLILRDHVEAEGREALIRAMARSPEFHDRWRSLLWDWMSIARVGKLTTPLCFERTTTVAQGTELAAWVRDEGPSSYFTQRWTFADLAESALRLDDLSPLFRANILGFSARDRDANTMAEAIAHRRILGELFLRNYTGRALECLPCHNSEWSVTGDNDPAQDRTWEIAGAWERPLFGTSDGGDPEQFWPYFRRFGVVGGFLFSSEPNDLPATPERGCIATHVWGCAGCACERAVCDADPSCCEELWSQACADRCVATADNHCAEPVLVYPWGMDARCGRLVNPDRLHEDFASAGAFYIASADATASAWDIETHFQRGLRALRDGGLPTAAAADDDGARAFAALWAMRIVDRIWTEAMGSPLTIQHGLPRNRAQRDELRRLTARFVSSDFSLVEVLVAITENARWNPLAPGEGGLGEDDPAYAWPAIFDPWTAEDDEPARRGNGYGELLVGRDPRAVQIAVHRAMGWRPPEQFMGGDGADEQEMQRLQEAIGVWQKEGNRGSRAPTFQQSLAWEAAYGSCADTTVRPWGCLTRGDPGCPGCACEAAVCAANPSCCETRWGEDCVLACATEGCAPAEPAPPDFIDVVLTEAPAGTTVEQGLLAVRDRLLGDGRWEEGERRLFAAGLPVALDDVLEADGADVALRAGCATFLMSPKWWVSGDAQPGTPAAAQWTPRLASSAAQCARLEEALGRDLGCR